MTEKGRDAAAVFGEAGLRHDDAEHLFRDRHFQRSTTFDSAPPTPLAGLETSSHLGRETLASANT